MELISYNNQLFSFSDCEYVWLSTSALRHNLDWMPVGVYGFVKGEPPEQQRVTQRLRKSISRFSTPDSIRPRVLSLGKTQVICSVLKHACRVPLIFPARIRSATSRGQQVQVNFGDHRGHLFDALQDRRPINRTHHHRPQAKLAHKAHGHAGTFHRNGLGRLRQYPTLKCGVFQRMHRPGGADNIAESTQVGVGSLTVHR